MIRWASVVALFLVATILTNTACYARCVVSNPPGAAAVQAPCCPEHAPAKTQPPSDCPHQYSHVKDVELTADVWNPAPASVTAEFIATTGVVSLASGGIVCSRFGFSAQPPGIASLSVLRI